MTLTLATPIDAFLPELQKLIPFQLWLNSNTYSSECSLKITLFSYHSSLQEITVVPSGSETHFPREGKFIFVALSPDCKTTRSEMD